MGVADWPEKIGRPGFKVAHVARLPRAVIVGAGGLGKSTLLKQMLALNAREGRVPVWVSLSSLPTDGTLSIHALLDHLVLQARTQLGIDEVNRAFFEESIAEGTLTIGFDALDEGGSLARRQKLRGLIVEVAREWKQCRVFVTSRREVLEDTPFVGFRSVPDEALPEDVFIHVEPQPLELSDVEPFLKLTFQEGEALAKTLLQRTGIEALLATPLTLTLLGLMARTPKGLPATRTPLFARCAETVCETWEDAKDPSFVSDGLDATQRLDVLRRLGWAAQQTPGATLTASAARAVVGALADRQLASRAKPVVTGLARRNLLLRAELSDDGGNEVRSVQFSHPQFREYLAGAHLAEQFQLDRSSATGAIAPHWFDTEWLDVLHFALATLEDRAARDAFLVAILDVEDPFGDLIHRPELLVARLLARVTEVSPCVVTRVVTTLERVALGEPALAELAFSALLALSSHGAALKAVESCASGQNPWQTPANAASGKQQSPETLRRRLRAIESYSTVRGGTAALKLLPAELPANLDDLLVLAALRYRLGDRDGAADLWKEAFAHGARNELSERMQELGERPQFEAWLLQKLAKEVTFADAGLAHKLGILPGHSPVFGRIFETALAELKALPFESFGPDQLSAIIFATLETDLAKTAPGAVSLLSSALQHPAYAWFVGPRIAQAVPARAAEATAALASHLLDPTVRDLFFPDFSRLNVAVQALCEGPDDVVPALLFALTIEKPRFNRSPIVQSLRGRGQAAAALAVLKPQVALTLASESPAQDERRRRAAWSLARELDEAAALELVDAAYRRGLPEEDAQRLSEVWHASGVSAIAVPWMLALRGRSDPAAQRFVELLTQQVGELRAHDEKDLVEDELEDTQLEQAFYTRLAQIPSLTEDAVSSRGLEHVVDLLSQLARRLEASATLRCTDSLLDRLLAEHAAPEATAAALTHVLSSLSFSGLRSKTWLTRVADFARTLNGEQRADLVRWLNENA